jgi:hypothetical protein
VIGKRRISDGRNGGRIRGKRKEAEREISGKVQTFIK